MRKNAINLKKVGVIFFLMPGLIYSQNTKEKDTLKEQKIEDVVIVGYKTQKKSSLTAAVSVISDKKLKDTNTSDVSSMLQGKAAGAQIMQSGAPGSTATVKIRGTSTINGPTDALWVVDGVMMNGTPNLDPNQIESINILKDATSTALYGSRGANGIVQVFTKSGTSSGKGTLNVSMNTSFNTFTNGKFKLMDGEQFYDYFNSLQNVPATAPRGVRAPGYNWLKNGTQTGVAKNYTVDFRGGSQNSKTYISGNYYDETGTIKGFDYNRLSFRINHEQTVKPWLILKPKVSLSYTTGKDVRASLFEMYLNLPWDNPRDANGNYVNPNTSVWYGRDHRNYLYDQQWNYGKNNQLDLVGNMDAEIKITDYLKFITTNNVTYRNFDSMYYIDPRSISGESNKGELSETYLKDISKFFNQMLRFDKDFGVHNVNALAAYEYSDRFYKTSTAGVFGVVPGTDIFDTGASSGHKPSGTKFDRAYNALLFNAEYVYDKKYFVQGSLRSESSSAFGANHRSGLFYSYSAGWNVHKEKFFHVKQINEWKLRASSGLVGNTPAPNYGWQDLYALTQKYNGQIGATWSQLGNPDLTWESIVQNNIGTDIRAFDNRLTINIDYFNNKTKNLLALVTLPALTGVDRQYLNIGDVKNKGWEFNVNYAFIKTKDVTWDLGFNVSTYQNEVLSTRNNAIQYLNSNGAAIPGYDVTSFYMRKWMGVNPDNGAGLWEVVNADGSKSLTSDYNKASLQVVGNATPDYYGSFSTNLTIKNFYMNANVYFSQGGQIYNFYRSFFDSDGAYPYYNQMVLQNGWNRWEKPGDIATHPVALYDNNNLTNNTSSRYLEDASFVKLRSIRFGYNFPKSLIEKLNVNTASIFIMGENLFTITKFSGVDPEVGPPDSGTTYSGTAGGIYPIPRRFSLGFNFSF
ncbi:TonB-linked outer membrane protein, SusC/RagA family [Chryseobacterium wanjuense]|uniref:TonB-linked outer membrane protein, SusC/RagA family n=1 Tax=Chryseobacterium wanjuense TaxID=356305 RepID=A0A1I0QX27_9FLAO|nr:SusC/RagA family TonB-linked outer membrane protein [Chryseobacterium wanjuense]SEW32332.1 TonB-linked outer membrane protein, SusC/RagA family [Chryseobacterium wanjuense]